MLSMYELLTKCEVKIAGYWPSSFSTCLWTEMKLRSINSQKKNLLPYFLRSTRMAYMCKPLDKQPLRLRKCGDQPFCLQDLAKSGLTSLPAEKIMPKQQNSKTKTYNYSNAARNNFEKTSQGMQAVRSPTNPWAR